MDEPTKNMDESQEKNMKNTNENAVDLVGNVKKIEEQRRRRKEKSLSASQLEQIMIEAMLHWDKP
jgi:hypothetical protein